MKEQYCQLLKNRNVKEKCKEFSRKSKLDTYLYDVIQEIESHELEKFVTIALSLSHGQATVERGFNINKELLGVNLKEKSQRVVHDAISSAGVGLQDFKIPEGLMNAARTAASVNKDHLAIKVD